MTGLTVLLLSACTMTNGSGSAATAMASSAQPGAVNGDEDALICERVRVTGTRIPKKVCMTRAQREAQYQQAQEDIRDMQSRRIQDYSGIPL
jgi:hypothetical protein